MPKRRWEGDEIQDSLLRLEYFLGGGVKEFDGRRIMMNREAKLRACDLRTRDQLLERMAKAEQGR